MDYRVIFLLVCGLSIVSCGEHRKGMGFTHLEADHTGISFSNEIVETEKLNVMQYEYLYNGGGVGIGDFNGDDLPDIYFTGNAVKNKLYLNNGNFEFTDITTKSGVAGKDGWKTGVSVADVNGDGLLDIYVCYSGLGENEIRSNQLFINQGNSDQNIPVFEDHAKEYGLDAPGSFSTQAAFFDYDRDGDLDMFLLNHSKTFYSPFFNSDKLRNARHPYFGNRLYHNENNQFTDISEEAGIYGSGLNFGLGVAVSDFNMDGYPDIFVSNDYDEQDFLYINLKNGKFEDRSHRSIGHLSKFSMGNDAADINNDGLVDLVTLDMLPEDNYRQKLLKGPDEFDRYQLALDNGYHHQQMRNMLQLHRGNDDKSTPVFSEIGQIAGISATDWSWSVLLADYDNDGKKDVFISNGYLRDYTNMDFVKFHMNDAIEKERAKGRELFDEKGKKANEKAIFDLVNKMPSSKVRNYAFKNEGELRFKNVSQQWGLDNLAVSTGAAYADLDLDGDLDLVVSTTNEPAAVYRNESRQMSQKGFVRIRLHGSDQNSYAIGARVWLETDSSSQYLENYPARGYQSSVDPILHFGLGNATARRIKIVWPDGTVTLDDRPQSDLLAHYYQKNGGFPDSEEQELLTDLPYLEDITTDSDLQYAHTENDFVDFKNDRLALKQYSKSGPRLSVGDLNGDGFEDVFVGGSSGQVDVVFLSLPGGGFKRSTQAAFDADKYCETTGAVFFDADSDGDLDIYAVSGGSDFPINAKELQDRLYLNDGTGVFAKAGTGVIPVEFSNGSCVAAGDFDNDGDEDLFIGGGVISGKFPLASPGGILINESDVANGRARFALGTGMVNDKLRQPGLVTDAKWTDINNDGFLDLVLVGEWMPVRVFLNQQNGQLAERTKEMNLGMSAGLWQRVSDADIDGDGDTDLIVGNVGTNLPFGASADEPLRVYTIDYYGNGNITPIICSYVQGKSYPIASLDEIQNALPVLKKKFLRYEDYATASIEDLFSPEILGRSGMGSASMLESVLLVNDGQGSFHFEVLPKEVQFSVAQSIVFEELTGDKIDDILISGNFYPFRAQYGPADASTGILLAGEGNGKYRTVKQNALGAWMRGDIRDVKLVGTSSAYQLIVSKNSGGFQVLRLRKK